MYENEDIILGKLKSAEASLGEKVKKINRIYLQAGSNLRTAFSGITDADEFNQYEIYIPEGTYDVSTWYTSEELNAVDFQGLFVPDYVTLIGLGKREDTIITLTYGTQNISASTINLSGSSGLKNLYIIGNNTRYAIHDDTQYTDNKCYRLVENCIIEGINTYYSCAYGSGLHSNAVWEFKDTIFKLVTGNTFSVHSNVALTSGADITFTNCKFIAKGNTVMKFGGVASKYINRVKFFGCQFPGITMQEEVTSSGTGCDFTIEGSGNSFGMYVITVTDGKEYYMNFADECATLIASESITKGRPVARNGYYARAQGGLATELFYGIAMTSALANDSVVVKKAGYVKISETTLGTVNVGDKIGISGGALAVVTSGKYIGICDISGYFRLCPATTV